MGYAGKATKGLGWVGFLQISSKGIIFLKYIVIARFLTPAEFGLFGIAMLTISFFESVTETGISAFLVQTDESDEEYVSSAWVVTIARGLLLFLLTIVLAYPISTFFNSSSSIVLILIAGLLPLVRGFVNPSVIKFQKHLDFDKEYLYRITVVAFDFLISAVLILTFKSALSLVVSLVLSTIFEMVLSLLVIKPRPRFVFEVKKIKELFHFGKWLTLVVSANYLAQQIDSIVVGKVLGITSLGIYQLAQKFSLQIMEDAGDIFSRVCFPLFAKIKNDTARTKRALFRILAFATISFGFLTIVIFLFSKDILLIFIGAKWIGAEAPLRIFSITGLVTAFMAITGSLFLAHARQDITAKIVISRLIILSVLIVPASLNFGVIGASFVSLVSYVAVLPLALTGVRSILKR